jgi:hypothetical protein
MGDLQSEAKPHMLRLAFGKWWTLDRAAQKALASWICCGTITSEFDTPANISIPKSDRDYLRANLEPPTDTWRIWIGHLKDNALPGFMAHHPIEVLERDEDLEEANARHPIFNTVAASFVIGETYITVLRCPFPTTVAAWIFNAHLTARLIQIWPIRHNIVLWPHPLPLSQIDVYQASSAFFRFGINAAKRRVSSTP